MFLIEINHIWTRDEDTMKFQSSSSSSSGVMLRVRVHRLKQFQIEFRRKILRYLMLKVLKNSGASVPEKNLPIHVLHFIALLFTNLHLKVPVLQNTLSIFRIGSIAPFQYRCYWLYVVPPDIPKMKVEN